MKYKFIQLFSLLMVLSASAQAHHWYQENHDIETLVTVEVEVSRNRFINPHPFFYGKVVDAMGKSIDQYGDLTQEWELQMDNRWELQELGFDKDTFSPGDKLIVIAHPGLFKKNVLYVKAIEHSRLGFRYEHNVRYLLKLD